MASKGRNVLPPENSTRRRLQDVLGQARAVLRNSQQFRGREDNHNNNLSSRLIFQQQQQEPDYWTTIAEPEVLDPKKQSLDDPYYGTNGFRKPKRFENDFGPFRESVKSPMPTATSTQRKMSTLQSKTRNNLPQESGVSRVQSEMSTSSTFSVDTKDLMVSDSEQSISTDSEISMSSQKAAKKTIRLTPLKPADVPGTGNSTKSHSSQQSDKSKSNNGRSSLSDGEKNNSITTPPSANKNALPNKAGKNSPTTTHDHDQSWGKNDEFWLEKSLFTRGQQISDAAYNALKQTYADKQADQSKRQGPHEAKDKVLGAGPGTEPEYTADWISDAASTEFSQNKVELKTDSEIDVPASEYVDETMQEIDDVAELDDNDDTYVNTESIVKTATELEASGVLDEIVHNLHQVLEISDAPESQDFTGMSQDEKTFAKEYDEVMQNKYEPLQSIFADSKVTPRSDMDDVDIGLSEQNTSITGDETGGREEYENTFDTYQNTNTKSSKNTSSAKNASFSTSSKKFSSKSKVKSISSSVITSSKKTKSSSATVQKSKSKSANVSSGKRGSSLLPPGQTLEAPTTSQQKNIQNILEKEVYMKELNRLRSEKLKQERDDQRLQKLAKKSTEKSKKTIFKEPDYTEILLPELFKYKSVSGLQAAKAKRSANAGPMPSVNYGAPYFNMAGAVANNDYGVTSMAAQVDSLDIPDLVREVLASNERMYRMTIETSQQMAKSYKDRMRMKSTKLYNRKR